MGGFCSGFRFCSSYYVIGKKEHYLVMFESILNRTQMDCYLPKRNSINITTFKAQLLN